MMTTKYYFDLNSHDKVSWLENTILTNSLPKEDFYIYILKHELDPLAKWFIIKSLGLLRSKRAVEIITEHIYKPNIDFGNTTIHLLIAWYFIQIGSEVYNDVINLAKSDNENCRKVAVDALGGLYHDNEKEVINILANILKKDSWNVKMWASLSLSKIGDASLEEIEKMIINREVDVETSVLLLDTIDKIGLLKSTKILNFVKDNGNDVQKLMLEKLLNKKLI